MRCTALGAEFNTAESTLHLLANVRMDGLAHGQPLHVTAARADINRNSDVAEFTRPVVSSGDHRAGSDTAVLHLRTDGSIQRVQGMDHVLLTSPGQQVTADRMNAVLDLQSIPQSAQLSGSVVLIGNDPLKPMHGSASSVDIAFNPRGSPTSVVATGAAKLSMVDRTSNPQGLARSVEGNKITALLASGSSAQKGSTHITEMHAVGSARASGESPATPAKGIAPNTAPLPVKTIQVAAEDLRLLFTTTSDGKSQPQKLYGIGNTLLQQDAPLGEQETTSGDKLEIVLASAPSRAAHPNLDTAAMNIASATQAGHVKIQDRAASKAGAAEPAPASTGTADRATFDGATQTLTLTGDAHLYHDHASVAAPSLSLDRRTQDADANSGVQATIQPAEAPHPSNAPANARNTPVTHIVSASAHFDQATHLASFSGSDGQPARMWQDASQVQAATLLFDGTARTFSARPSVPGGLIHAVFAASPVAAKPGELPRTPSIIRVAAAKMDYDDLQREATFSGHVVLEGTMGEIRGQSAVVFLAPATKLSGKQSVAVAQGPPIPLSGSIDRVVVHGSVQMDQPGRHGSAEQLLYTASTGTYILTGTPALAPHIMDAQQGSITGTALSFSDAGSTIVVSGNPAAPNSKGGRVRTETHVSPGKEERQ
jgi:lipopolysaccharide export system protein LptA